MRAPAIAMLCGAVACAHPARIGVRGGEVLQHLSELGQNGYAELETVMVSDAGIRAADRENVFLEQTVTFRGETTTLAKLVEGCPPFPASTPCLLIARSGDVIVLRTIARAAPASTGAPADPSGSSTNRERHDIGTVFGVLSLASFGGTTLCLILCESDKAQKSLALGGAGLVFGLLWAISTGARD